MNTKLTSEQKIKIIKQVFNACVNFSDSFDNDNIGADLAYLFGAIAKGTCVDFTENGAGERPALYQILINEFPETHVIWKFILR